MKILTVIADTVEDFDAQVNEALEKGYLLGRRGPAQVGHSVALYAELVQLDPEPAPETGPIQALHQVREFCNSVHPHDCGTDRCPLNAWCMQLRHGGDPTDWDLPDLPEVEA